MNVPCGCNLVDNLITSYLYLWQMALFSSHVSNANFPLNCRPAAARSQTLPTTTDHVLHSANDIKTVIHTCVKSYKKKKHLLVHVCVLLNLPEKTKKLDKRLLWTNGPDDGDGLVT